MRTCVLVIGGTTESRQAARAIREAGFDVLVSTATEYGAELVGPDADARSGAMTVAEMAALATGCTAIVDATHPFARQASETARQAAALAGVEYARLEREPACLHGGAVVCDSPEAAAEAAVRAAGEGGTVLLTVGTRTLGTYVSACRRQGVRCVARVLPVAEALKAAEEAGLQPADIVAMQGPTSAALDEAILRHLGATVLVTKESGPVGGVPEKLQAAAAVGAVAIVVSRPDEPAEGVVSTVEELVSRLREIENAGPQTEPVETTSGGADGLVHIYTGDGKGKTTAGVGLAARASGAGLRVAFIQFVKGGRESSELESLRRLGVEVTRPARRSSGLMRGAATDDDHAAATAALEATRRALAGDFDVVVLDEACVAASKGLVQTDALISAILARADHVEVVLTGRGAPEPLLDVADYVTEMRMIKHPYRAGVHARRGVEF